MSEIDWESLSEGMDKIEAEFAGDPRDETARTAGVPLWAFDMYRDQEKSRQAYEEEDPENAPTQDEAAAVFVDEFVSSMEQAGALVAWDGAKQARAAQLQGKVTIELNGKGLFRLLMGLKVAHTICSQMGPAALGMAGMNPNAKDAMHISELTKALGLCLACVTYEDEPDYVGTVVDARQ